jgi:hypothetical protein
MRIASMSIPAVASLLLALIPAPANGQPLEPVPSGTRVRVSVAEPYLQEQGPWRRQQLRGTVASITPDTLYVSVPGTVGTLAVARESIRRLDVSRGHPSRAATALERAFSGAIVGAMSAAISNDPDGTKWPNYSRRWRAAGEGAKWGAAFGAVVGFALPTERWRRVRGHAFE